MQKEGVQKVEEKINMTNVIFFPFYFFLKRPSSHALNSPSQVTTFSCVPELSFLQAEVGNEILL
jgi:hypothetical protein|tara:strand:- start:457 stop:648 length:192 start_codon:yes stop_codon:yes gene_type:complete